MKNLLMIVATGFMLATMQSCGYVKVPLFEQHLDDDHGDKPETTQVLQSMAVRCNMAYFNNRCTNAQGIQVLPPYAFFSHDCYLNYNSCLQGR